MGIRGRPVAKIKISRLLSGKPPLAFFRIVATPVNFRANAGQVWRETAIDKNMQSLIPCVNKLQAIFSQLKFSPVDLPEVVAIGSRSERRQDER